MLLSLVSNKFVVPQNNYNKMIDYDLGWCGGLDLPNISNNEIEAIVLLILLFQCLTETKTWLSHPS